MIRSERGYALLLVIFMILILTILGTAVVASSLGGATRTETRESDIQSLHLAEKALNEAIAYLIAEYDGRSDISPRDLAGKIDTFHNNYSMLERTRTELEGVGQAGITAVEVEALSGTSSFSSDTSYRLTLTAEADVNGVKRKLEQSVVIDSFPDFLNYAFGSENDVIINGSAYAIGNLYVGGDLRLYNQALYTYQSNPRAERRTEFPTVYGNVFIRNFQAVNYCKAPDACHPDHISSYHKLQQNEDILLKELLGDSFDYSNIRGDKNKLNFVSINFDESFLDKAAEAVVSQVGGSNLATVRANLKAASLAGGTSHFSAGSFINELADKGISRLAHREEPLLDSYFNGEEFDFEAYEAAMSVYNAYLSHFYSGTQLTETMIFDGDLTLDGMIYEGLRYNQTAKNAGKWFIVNGDLIIDNEINNLSGRELLVQANILVTGDVKIMGMNIKVDSIIFALGEGKPGGQTIVQDAGVQGIGVNGSKKQLVLISKPNILLNRFEAFRNFGVYNDTNKLQHQLDAFFYTEGEAELYGVGSAFWLNGGFFSKGDLTINAVRGTAQEGAGVIAFLNSEGGSAANSRFIVEHDPTIFEAQYEGLPRVQQLSVKVGGKRLIK